jgi:hypothetical protein
MTIKLEQFSATIDVESVEITSVTDNVKAKTASVNIVINNKYGTALDGFTYTTSWEDDDVLAWANIELEKYEII